MNLELARIEEVENSHIDPFSRRDSDKASLRKNNNSILIDIDESNEVYNKKGGDLLNKSRGTYQRDSANTYGTTAAGTKSGVQNQSMTFEIRKSNK